MPNFIAIDFETRSRVDLRTAGVYRYAEDNSTDVWCAAYTINGGPMRSWVLGQAVPHDLAEAVRAGFYVRAWNAQFERLIWRDVWGPKHGIPIPDDDRYVCSMVLASAAGLPASLEEAAIVLDLATKKDMEGRRLMLQMSQPRRIEEDGTVVWWTDRAKIKRLVEYCATDVVVESAIWPLLPPAMDRRERAIYLLDQRINDRGIRLDAALIAAGRELATTETARINREIARATDGKVSTVNKIMDLKQWVMAHLGRPIETLDKAAVEALCADDTVPEHVRHVLDLRAAGAKSSVKKLDAMRRVMCADGSARGLLRYYGAGTGRWAGRLIQPQNFPRGSITITEDVVAAIMARDVDAVEAHGPVMDVVSSALRGCLIADPGTALYVADFAQIEARVVAWLAGQSDLLALFASGGLVYEEMAAVIFGVPVDEVTKEQRQVGKAAVLGCGFQMGPKRFAESAGVDLDLAERAVAAYREQNFRIKQLWFATQDTAIAAVQRQSATPLAVKGTGKKLTFRLHGDWLAMGLPSGRSLWYHRPRLVERETPWGETRPAVEVDVQNGQTRKWEAQMMYGGLWTENATQAVARDLMADALFRLETEGFAVRLTVHDEVIATSEPSRDVGGFVDVLSAVPEWAAGCPVMAEGWTGMRYRK